MSDVEAVACPACGDDAAEPVECSPAQMAESSELFQFVRCGRCALVRLSPRPTLAALPRWYDDTYLPHRGSRAWGRFAPLVQRAEAGTDRARCRVVEHHAARSGRPVTGQTRVLDVGCGRPSFLAMLQRRTGAACTGLDFAPDAWDNDAQAWSPLQLVAGTTAEAPLPDQVDLVTMWHALEHDPQPVESLQRLHRITRSGGLLVVEVPDHDSIGRRLHGPHWAGYHTPRHLASYTQATLRTMLERAGWTVRHQQRHGTLDPYVLWWLGRQERLGRSVRGDLAPRFAAFVAGKVTAMPLTMLQRWLPLGVQLTVAQRET